MGRAKGQGQRPRGALLDAFPISHLPTPGQEWAGLGGYREVVAAIPVIAEVRENIVKQT